MRSSRSMVLLRSLPVVFGLVVGCAPRLYDDRSKETGEAPPFDPPENSWPVCSEEIPGDLNGTGFSTGEVIPGFSGPDQLGATLALYQFYGCVTVVDISTMWCAPCQALAEGVDETAAEYADEGVVYLTVLAQDLEGNVPDASDLSAWADGFDITQPIVGDTGEWYRGVVTTNTFPRVMIVGRDMTILEADVPATDAEIRAAIEAQL
ncbi:TlpA family protein disulfide reductase [Myxococcota bacterium]|nr:TlpA family protein disulfide reductase [Myxococcota bacterium]